MFIFRARIGRNQAHGEHDYFCCSNLGSRVIFAPVNLRGQGGHDPAAPRESGKSTAQMKKHILTALAAGSLAFFMGGQGKALAAGAALKTEPQKIGYALGMSLGKSLKTNNISPDVDFLAKAIRAQLTGASSLMTADEVRAVLRELPGGPASLPAGNKKFKNVKEEIGYAIGVDFTRGLTAAGLGLADVDLDDLAKGVKDLLAGNPALLTADEAGAVFTSLKEKVEAKQIAQLMAQDPKFKADSEKNQKEGAEFLARNKTAPGVITLTNGLQYTVLTAGSGPIPKPTDSVRVNYRGMLLDGTQFDASPPGQPFPCNLSGGVITGWLDILKLMPAGSKWKVFIPSNLAYGARGFLPRIPPNATLIFEMELASIDQAK
jgi:FKBP-type peptidyl-prolyl cis-trans isomerase